MRRRPFVPPSCGREVPRGCASTGTMASSVPPAAKGITGARSVPDCTQGQTAEIQGCRIPIGQARDKQAATRPFCPLPVKIITPIKVPVLERYLEQYPCPGTRDYLVAGFRDGFDIGFRGSFEDTNSRPRNLWSARNNAEKVTEAIFKEVTRGHTSGPFPFPPFPIPIAHQSGRLQSRTVRQG